MAVFISLALQASFLFTLIVAAPSAANFLTNVDITWGDGRAKISDSGNLLQLSMDEASGSGFQSKQQYVFGRFDMRIKLIPGDSKGTITAYYLSSEGSARDEVDFEFLGPGSRERYVLSTNVITHGTGSREQQFHLWFDPRLDFHTYSILWNQQQILFYVDGTPIRVFKNAEGMGVSYANKQPMRLISSLWFGDWAGNIDWRQAPFVASFRDLNADACVWSEGEATPCPPPSASWWNQSLDGDGVMVLKRVREEYMTYDYCGDTARFSQGLPAECSSSL